MTAEPRYEYRANSYYDPKWYPLDVAAMGMDAYGERMFRQWARFLTPGGPARNFNFHKHQRGPGIRMGAERSYEVRRIS